MDHPPEKNDGAVLSNGFRVPRSPSYFHFPDCAIENRFNESHLSSLGRRAHAHAPLGQVGEKKEQHKKKVIYLFMLRFQESTEKITLLSFACLSGEQLIASPAVSVGSSFVPIVFSQCLGRCLAAE